MITKHGHSSEIGCGQIYSDLKGVLQTIHFDFPYENGLNKEDIDY